MPTAYNSLPHITPKIQARFWSKVNKNGPLPDQSNPHYFGLDRCWTWMAGKCSKGYGAFCINGKQYGSHRVSLAISGVNTDGFCSLHSCDNPACVNPQHLRAGTNDENMADGVLRARFALGDKNGSRKYPEKRPRGESSAVAKLNNEKVREMRSRYAEKKVPYRAISSHFGVDCATARSVILRHTWKHVD